jgi:hypothetical protein
MRKTLAGLSRDMRDDGPGSELAVALALAIRERPYHPPMIG